MDSETNTNKPSSVLESQKRYDNYLRYWEIYSNALYFDNLTISNLLSTIEDEALDLTSYLYQLPNYSLSPREFALFRMPLPDGLDWLTYNEEASNFHLEKVRTNDGCEPIEFVDSEKLFNINLAKYIEQLSKYEIDNNKPLLDVELIAVALRNGAIFQSKAFNYWNHKTDPSNHCQDLKNDFQYYKVWMENKKLSSLLVKNLHNLLIKEKLIVGELDQMWEWRGKSNNLLRYLISELKTSGLIKTDINIFDVIGSYINIPNIDDMRNRGYTFDNFPVGSNTIDYSVSILKKICG